MTLMTPLLASLLAMTSPAAGVAMTAEEAEVFAGEEAYWDAVNAGDTAAFLALWAEDFRGWPCGQSATATLTGLEVAVESWFADVAKQGLETTIEPQGVVLGDGFAVTYLAARTRSSRDRDYARGQKLVHTWRETPAGWKIVGGMCAELPTPE
ncbi:MAG: DUF4440 domain-containing protein [Pseudomonadota bacterium]